MRISFGASGVIAAALGGVLLVLLSAGLMTAQDDSRPCPPNQIPSRETPADAEAQSTGCITCHGRTEAASMHKTGTVIIGCADCHGGHPDVLKPAGAAPGSKPYREATKAAHPKADIPALFPTSANPVRSYTDWLRESACYIRFVNPGDLRVAKETCGSAGCHTKEVEVVKTSMMTHGAMLWQAALYNNGAYPFKNARFGESYSPDGVARRISSSPPPSQEETYKKGILPQLDPLLRWESSQPGNILRQFERGGGMRADLGNPNPEEDPGRPDDKLSDRGFGTNLRTDPVILGLQKTRLLDPMLSMPGTNDHPGDYRSSGCSACHVIYANDRDPAHSAYYSQYKNQGTSSQSDPTISKSEHGHPIHHELTRSIPTSQCIVCHIHPGTNMVASYLGYTWWDNETDGDKMYPPKQHNPSDEERYQSFVENPEAAAARGLWKDPDFLTKTGEPKFNESLEHTRFADFHGHGWIFRAVYKRDREGNLLDKNNATVPATDKDRFTKAVHLQDIHVDKGMHCEDCHFSQDAHGNGNLYGETRNAIEIDCIDCHGDINQKATLRTSGTAAPEGGRDMGLLRTPNGKQRFFWEDGKLYQRSMLNEEQPPWEVVQTKDAITPNAPHYNPKARYAMALRRDGLTFGSTGKDDPQVAHPNSRMTCYTCHSSWTTSCFGCHLPMVANKKMPMLHNEGLPARNYTSYNFEVLRDDIYMLGIDGTVTKNRIAPTRSTCAVVVSSQNANRDWIYYMQQTISAEGFSGTAFSSYFPHTVRSTETKACTDCHISDKGDNNAWMAQLLMQGTNLVNFMGRYVYVAEGSKGFDAVPVAEHDDPPAVFGSDLQEIVYGSDFDKLKKRGRELKDGEHHEGDVLDVQLRGEYLYAATGKGGFRAFDVAQVDNKNFSEKMTTAPVSPLGQRFYVRTKNATAVGSPSTLAIDPGRTHNPENEEKKVAPMYGFIYVTDSEEGLVVIGDPNAGVGTLLDGNPANNFLKRAATYNPNGQLNGARRITIAGTYAYILCNRGLVVVDISNPLLPKSVAEIGSPALIDPQGIAIQFRYAFVVDKQGLKVLDVTSLAAPRVVSGAVLPLSDARNIYVARTYAYVAGGRDGMVIINVTQPEHPKPFQVYNADHQLNDTRDIKIGMTNASAFAYVADGKNGMRIVQLFSPKTSPEYLGFSPRPVPKLIATYRTHGPALAISKAMDRDRAVDENGNQLSVFNRRGSRPFNQQEMENMYRHRESGRFFMVSDTVPGNVGDEPRDKRSQVSSK